MWFFKETTCAWAAAWIYPGRTDATVLAVTQFKKMAGPAKVAICNFVKKCPIKCLLQSYGVRILKKCLVISPKFGCQTFLQTFIDIFIDILLQTFYFTDIDECKQGECQGNDRICVNTLGGFKCHQVNCPPNYVHDANNKKLARYLIFENMICFKEWRKMPFMFEWQFSLECSVPMARLLKNEFFAEGLLYI